MSRNRQLDRNEGNLLNFFGLSKTKQHSPMNSQTDDFTSDQHDNNHTLLPTNSPHLIPQQNSDCNNNKNNTIEAPSTLNQDNTNWSSLAMISKFKVHMMAQKMAPIKRNRPVHCTETLIESTPLVPAIGIHSTNDSPKKRYPPATSFFQPPEKRRIRRLSFRSPYTKPDLSFGNKDHIVPIGKNKPAPLPITMIPAATCTKPSTSTSSSSIQTLVSSSALPSHTSESTYSKSSRNTTSPPSPSASTKDIETKLNKKNDEYLPGLSDEQRRVLDMVVKDRQSIFLTGSAGTGKSVLMKEIIKALRNKYGEGVAVTASTGIAACHIGGVTLYAFAGIGLGDQTISELIRKVEMSPAAKKRWKKTQILIIDEISMVDAILFDKLAQIGRHIHGRNEAFGGIQVIVTGDFFQLPPVRSSGFAFEAETWSSVIKKTVVLAHVFRQKDPEFVDILNEMRIGVLSQKAIKLFRSLERPLPASSIEPTKLYPVKHQVERSNNMRLEALAGSMHEFQAIDTGPDPKRLENCIAPAVIQLKKDAQVMLLKNVDASLVNGSLGKVVGFAGDENYDTLDSIMTCLFPRRKQQVNDVDLQHIISKRYPVVQFENSREHVIENESWSMNLADGTQVASREQVPLILAWAMSIHKSQGQTMNRVMVDLGQAFEDGMAYVALSRATSLQSLQITNFNPLKVTASRKVIAFYKTLQQTE